MTLTHLFGRFLKDLDSVYIPNKPISEATEPAQTTSRRAETVLFTYFGIDSKLAHLKCQTSSLNSPSRAEMCCKCQGGRGRALGLLNVTDWTG